MDDFHESELPIVHAEVAEWAVALGGGVAPRLFALVREDFGQDDAVVEEIVAYGIVLPDGSAATVPLSGRGFGRWLTPKSASRRMCSELIWLSPARWSQKAPGLRRAEPGASGCLSRTAGLGRFG